MNAFIKENFVLLAGIALPLLLTVIFFLSTKLTVITADPPQYSVVYTSESYQNNTRYPYRFVVEKDKGLTVRYKPDEDDNNWNKPRLFIHNPKEGVTTEISFPDFDPDKQGEYKVPELESSTLSTARDSPDGYHFEYSYRGSANLMTEMFGGGSRYRYKNILSNGNNRVVISNDRPYGSSEFVAWITEPQ